MQPRRLTLKREVLQQLSDADLSAIAGAAWPDTTKVAETAYSCLMYISCAFLHTCWLPESLACVQTG
jgi:hypothetical protein